MGLLGDEVLRPLVLADRKARHGRSRGRDRVELRAVADPVAEIENVRRGQVVV